MASKIVSTTLPKPVLNLISSDDNVYTATNQELWSLAKAEECIDDRFLDVDGSKYAASVSIDDPNPTVLKVRIHVDNDLIGQSFYLEARLRGTYRITCSGKVSKSDKAGNVTVDVNFRPPWVRPEIPWDVTGDLSWRARHESKSTVLLLSYLDSSTVESELIFYEHWYFLHIHRALPIGHAM